MELDYELHGETAKIFYAETLVSQLKSLKIEQSVLFLTNQRYYDLFADKINQLFANPRKIDWYICANTQCNHLIELSNLLTFAKRYNENEAFLIIGFGLVLEMKGSWTWLAFFKNIHRWNRSYGLFQYLFAQWLGH